VIVFAAGNARDQNGNTNYHALGNMRELINVAALDFDGAFSGYSTPGASLLITAPGGGYSGSITTTDRLGRVGYSDADYTPFFNGTSAAAPIASGVVALMLEANTNLSYRDVQDILALSATQTDSNSSGWLFNGASNWNGGGLHVSHDYGFGLIDATAAVRLAETWTTGKLASNEQSVTATGAGSLSIPDNTSTGASQSVSVNADFDVEWVEVAYTFWHSNASHLTMTLTSPSGTEVTLLETPTFSSYSKALNLSYTATSTFYRNESSQGNWTLKVVDSQPGLSGSLASWELRVYGAAGTANNTYFYTDEFATLTDSARRVLNDGSGTDTINASAVSTAVTMNLAAGASSTIAGQTLTIAGSTTIENLITGSGADTITGNDVANTITAGRGSDTINASGGNDTIVGGPGLDTVVYAGLASGYTVTDDGSGNSTVVDIDSSDGDTGTDTLSGIETILFAHSSGSGVGARTLSVDVPNSAPTLANLIADQTVLTDGSRFLFGIPTNTFTDADSGDTLTYMAHTASTASSGLPSWLSFDANTQILSGTATAADVGTTTIVVTATDQQGASVSDTFNLTVNDASTTPVDVVRFFNFTVGSHTFTISDAEDNSISSTQTDRLTREGAAFQAFAADSDSTDPVYRIENKFTGAVLFTADANERDILINNFADTFGDLGVAFHVYTSPPAGDDVQTVVRYRNETTGGHFLTNSIAERTFINNELSGLYTYEGIAFYTIA
jgi:subtilisin-like proprotein convertase family protein